MITKENLKQVITEKLGFVKDDEREYLFYRAFADVQTTIYVNFQEQHIQYPIEQGFKIEEETTTNFDQPENFVVFECVCRLFEKGYRPEHITLEKKWKLGHEAKGGRADICIKDTNGDMLAIIECKTPGVEYKKEHKNIESDGGQLFSYWQQERSTKWLILYTCDYEIGAITHTIDTIHSEDDPNLLKLAKKDDNLKVYQNAHTVSELHETWVETYGKAFWGDVLFVPETAAYKIGVRTIHKKDLVDFDKHNNVVNSFEEILRHNNVSDKENAFNRLVALFICKLVDEITKDDNDEMGFQYKPGTDTYESLQDRLQALHQQGMDKFMKEKIFYVPDNYAQKLVQQYTGQKRTKMIAELNNTLRKLKYYSNNDFAFKDIHNEDLFYQNGKILVEVVQLFEKYRIINSSNLQLLGDLFEQLLNKGFKQNEGQFFTPVPITRFIWYSLPLTQIIHHDGQVYYPKIIDYACGAGHFLTEGVDAVNFVVSKFNAHTGNVFSWVADKIFGVEKDYRLARVSKISLFMHGAGEGNIVFGDGLENYPEKNITTGSFDILTANPPYSVYGFKPHLKLKNNTFATLDKISNTGSEIETLFVERIAQLLKPNGIAAVILPSSILNKENESFISAREFILQNFYIRAIVQLGSKTFGATGTNTVIMFLQKFDEPPKRTDMVNDSLEAIFEGRDLTAFEDHDIIKEYLDQIKVDPDVYRSFLDKSYHYNEWAKDNYFKVYTEAFEKSAMLKNKQNKQEYKNASPAKKLALLDEIFYNTYLSLEKEKVKYFAYVYRQRTLVITAPTDNKGQEAFLGYKWSNRKGSEGIQIFNYGGLMYDNNDITNKDTLAGLIRDTFFNKYRCIKMPLDCYYYLDTKNMLSYDGSSFTKVIRTVRQRIRQHKNGMKLYKLSDPIFEIGIGERVLSTDIVENGRIPVYSANIHEPFGYVNKEILKDYSIPSVVWGIDGDWMVDIIPAKKPFYPTDHCGYIRVHSDKILPEYLALALETEGHFAAFSRTNRASTQRIKELSIEFPTFEKQERIIEKCKKLEDKIRDTEKQILEEKLSIYTKYNELFGHLRHDDNLFRIAHFENQRITITNENQHTYITTDNMLQDKEGIAPYEGNFDKIDYGIHYEKGDVLVSNIRPYLKKIWLAEYDGVCSPDVLALAVNDRKKIHPIYLYGTLSQDSFFDYVMDGTKGMKMPRGDKNHIMQYPVAIPDMKLQEQYVQFFINHKRMQLTATKEREKLIKEKATILDKYFK